MTERDALTLFAVMLGVMIVVGALLPALAPGLIRLLDATVLKSEPGADHKADGETPAP